MATDSMSEKSVSAVRSRESVITSHAFSQISRQRSLHVYFCGLLHLIPTSGKHTLWNLFLRGLTDHCFGDIDMVHKRCTCYFWIRCCVRHRRNKRHACAHWIRCCVRHGRSRSVCPLAHGFRLARQHHENRPTKQRIAQRSHIHTLRKKNRTGRGGNVDASRIDPARRKGADRRRLSALSCRGKKSKCRSSHVSPHLAALSREPNAPEPLSEEVLEMTKTVSRDRIQQRCVKRLDPVEKLLDDQKWTSDASQRPLRTWVPRGLLRS